MSTYLPRCCSCSGSRTAPHSPSTATTRESSPRSAGEKLVHINSPDIDIDRYICRCVDLCIQVRRQDVWRPRHLPRHGEPRAAAHRPAGARGRGELQLPGGFQEQPHGVQVPRIDNLSNNISTPYLRIHSAVRLEIVEQSSKPVVITDEGVEVMGSVGPYLLGQALILVTPAPPQHPLSCSARCCRCAWPRASRRRAWSGPGTARAGTRRWTRAPRAARGGTRW